MYLIAPLLVALSSGDVVPSAALAAAPPPRESDSSTSVLRVRARDLRDLRAALALSDDVWSHSIREREVDIRVSREARAALERAGVPFDVLIADVEAMIDGQAATRAARAAQGGVAGEDWYADVKDLAAIEARMAAWAAQHPETVTPIVVGTSLEGRPIRGVRISRAPNGADVPGFLFNACQHAREWATPMVAMLLAEQLIDGSTVTSGADASADPVLTAILEQSEVFIVPVANPDGYQYSWDEVRLWRKNRRNNGDGTFGVDLNRNWDYEWGGVGSSGSPSSETYRGPFPFSEPESQALADFVADHGRILGHIDFHSYSQLIFWPWGYTSDLCPDQPIFAALGAAMEEAIELPYGTNYVSGPAFTTIYPTSGAIIDWTYGTAGVLSTTIEVRDTGTYGFLIPAEEVRPCAEENASAAIAMMTFLLTPGFLSIDGAVPAAAEPEVATPVIIYAMPLASAFADPPRLRARIGTTDQFAVIESTPLGDSRYVAALPSAPCGSLIEFYVEWEGIPQGLLLPETAPKSILVVPVIGLETLWLDDFETDRGWISGDPGDTASSGQWVRVDPIGTIAQPEDDHSPFGTTCWVTGQGTPGGTDGAADVDGGITSLTSPWLDGSNPDSTLRYWRWYSNNLGASPGEDSMLVLFSSDGETWSSIEEVSESAAAWVEASFRVGDFLSSPGPFKVRFVARDLGSGSLVEAGIDDVSIEAPTCATSPGDLNQDGAVDGIDLTLVLGFWGECAGCVADINDDGVVDGNDLAIVLGAWSP